MSRVADREYLRLLHLAASDSEVTVEAAIRVVLASDGTPTEVAVRDRMRELSPAGCLRRLHWGALSNGMRSHFVGNHVLFDLYEVTT